MKNLCFWVRVLAFGALFALSVVPFSCRLTEEGIKLVGGDLASPKIVSFTVSDEKSLALEFSERAKIKNAGVRKATDTDFMGNIIEENNEIDEIGEIGASDLRYVFYDEAVYDDSGKKASLCFAADFEVGKKYELYGQVEDTSGNTLTFSLPFLGFNSRVPVVKIIAVHPKYSSSKRAGQTVYKNEFVSFFVATDGNLAGLEVFSAADGSDKSFLLPALDVKAGTFVTAHMRSRGAGCVSESPENLRSCRQEYASDSSLDLWSENTEACLGDTADIIMVRNSADGSVLSSVAYSFDGSGEALKQLKNNAPSDNVAKHVVTAENVTASKMIARTDSASIKNALNEENGTWLVSPVFSGSGKNKQINLGRFVEP